MIAMWYAFTKGNEQARTIIHATGNDDFGIADEITIRPDGRPELSQAGIARVFDLANSTLTRDLHGVQRNGKTEGKKLGKYLVSLGFEIFSNSKSQRGTSFTPEMVAATAVVVGGL